MTGPLCASHPTPEIWFADDPAGQAQAIAVCQLCPVRAACRVRGADEPWGVWGGLTAEERLSGLLLDGPEPVPVRHGVRGTGCHCGACRAAHARYMREWRERPTAVTASASIEACEQLAWM